MRKQGGGSIVNISSGNSRMINVGRTPYGITKGAVNLLTEQLGAEWAMYNIKVNAIAPGWIETEMVKTPLKKGILDAKKILSVSPIGRFGQVSEIAKLATFLGLRRVKLHSGTGNICRWRLVPGNHARRPRLHS